MSEKVLVVDDDVAIRKLLEVALKATGYSCIVAKNGVEAINKASLDAPSLILLDLGLPDMDGKQFIQKFREWSSVPIIVISARSNENEKIDSLEYGCDDYITKPFSTGELLARIKAVLRRKGESAQESPELQSENLTLDITSHIVKLDGNELKLTPKEFDLLKVMMQNEGKVLTHSWLLKEIWGIGYQSETHYLRVFINQLRQKIEKDPMRPKKIVTEIGIGYRFSKI